MSIRELVDIATIFGAFATGVGVLAAVIFGSFQAGTAIKNLKANRQSNQMQALIAFDEMLSRYKHVSSGLRPGGELSNKRELSVEELTEVERYMGLFERAKIFIDGDFLTLKHFRHLYGYHMLNVVSHPYILEEKLIKRSAGWIYFIELFDRLYPGALEERIEGHQAKG